jgi:protein-disulfide isomerase
MKSKVAIGAALAGAAVLGAIVIAYVSAQSGDTGKSAFTNAQEAEIREIVRDYIITNPDVLFESLNAYYEKRQEQAEAEVKEAAKASLSALLDDKHGFTAGVNPAAAKVAVVELFDYHCGHCKRAAGMVLDLTKSDPTVKVVFRDYPIFGENSDYAAQVALAAREQGKYKELHFAMMTASGTLTKTRVKEIAEKNGVNFAAIEAKLKDPAINKTLEETHRIAAEMQVDGTPTFIVATLDGSFLEVIPGFGGEEVKAAIAEAKKAAKS